MEKFLLPPSALADISVKRVVYPLMFKLKTSDGKNLHCGILEFTSVEGEIVMPEWMINQLNAKPGQPIFVQTIALPKGTFMKVKPRETAFTQLSNPRIVLEHALKQFSCISIGDIIIIEHCNRIYHLRIESLFSNSKPSFAISIIDTDLSVDFECPDDMKEHIDNINTFKPIENFNFEDLKFEEPLFKDKPIEEQSINLNKNNLNNKYIKNFNSNVGKTISGKVINNTKEKNNEKKNIGYEPFVGKGRILK